MSVQMNVTPQNIKPNKFRQKTKNLAVKAHHFAQRQVRHAFIKGSAICTMEAISPSPNWQAALIRTFTIDIGEACQLFANNKISPTAPKSHKVLSTKYQATNSLAIISDLTKATIKGGKKLLKKFRA